MTTESPSGAFEWGNEALLTWISWLVENGYEISPEARELYASQEITK